MTTNILKKLFVLCVSLPSIGYAQFATVPTGTNTSLTAYSYGSSIVIGGQGDYFAKMDNSGAITPLKSPSASPFINIGLSSNSSSLYTISENFSEARYQLKRSADGGSSWYTMFDTTGVYLLAFKMASPTFGMAAGLFGVILTTTDGGSTWTATRPDHNVDQYTTISTNGNTVILGGTEGNTGYFYKTTDMGATWTKSVANSTDIIPTAVQFLNANTVIATSVDRDPAEAFISRSVDAGNTWSTVSMGTNKAYFDVKFANETEGYAVGINYADSTGLIAKTTDGGLTWTEIKTSFVTQFNSIVLNNANEAMLAGTNGTLVKWDMSSVATGITAVDASNEVAVYPNPVSSQLNYTLSADATFTTAQIYTVTGQVVVQNTPVENNHSQIDVSTLAPGEYFLVLHANDQLVTKKFFKN